MSNLQKRLRASINIDAINGSRDERAVCQSQMYEAANQIDALQARIAQLDFQLGQHDSIIQNYNATIANRDRRIALLEKVAEAALNVESEGLETMRRINRPIPEVLDRMIAALRAAGYGDAG